MRVTTAAVRHSVMTFQANNSSGQGRALGGILYLLFVLQMIIGHCLDQTRLYGGARLWLLLSYTFTSLFGYTYPPALLQFFFFCI